VLLPGGVGAPANGCERHQPGRRAVRRMEGVVGRAETESEMAWLRSPRSARVEGVGRDGGPLQSVSANGRVRGSSSTNRERPAPLMHSASRVEESRIFRRARHGGGGVACEERRLAAATSWRSDRGPAERWRRALDGSKIGRLADLLAHPECRRGRPTSRRRWRRWIGREPEM